MNRISPVVARLSYTVFCVLRSVRTTDHSHAEKQKANQRTVFLQSNCIETAVATTLFIYIGWLGFRRLFFEEPVITPDNMLLGCILVLVVALGTKLCWIVWSGFQYWLNK